MQPREVTFIGGLDSATRDSAWCHDPIMSLHRSVDSDEEDGDEHPERPARTEGIVALAISQQHNV